MFHPPTEQSTPAPAPAPTPAPGRGRRRLTAVTRRGNAAAIAVTAAVGLIVGPSAGFVHAATLSGDSGTPPIVSVELTRDGTATTYTTPTADILNHSSDPVDFTSLVIDDGGLQKVVPAASAASIVNVGYPDDLVGVAVHQNTTEHPVGAVGFAEAVAQVYNSPDLRDYVTSDNLSQSPTEWGVDYHVMYNNAIGANQYLIVMERGGNTPVTLAPLDQTGGPLTNGETVTLNAPYGWDTGFAPITGTGAVQSMGISVIKVSSFLNEGATGLWGFAVDNNEEADVKFLLGSPSGAPVAQQDDSDDSEVSTDSAASDDGPVELQTLVYAGHDSGASCAGADNYVEAEQDDAVTYCYVITNTGSHHLDGITLSTPNVDADPVLMGDATGPLAPGKSVVYYAETTPPADDADGEVDDTFLNTASVSATQVDAGGVSIVGAEAATAKATASAFPADEELAAGITVSVTVYAGHDQGANCPGSNELLATSGEALTYCYSVTNTGNTHLDGITVAEPSLSTGLQGGKTSLAPDESTTFFVQAHLPDVSLGAYNYVVTAAGNPVDADGADMVGVDDVSAQASIEVGDEVPDALANADADAAASQGDTAGEPVAEPAAEPAADAVDGNAAESEDAADAAATGDSPAELAFTGWETWVLSSMAVFLLMGGLWLTKFAETSHPVFAWAAARRQLLDSRPAPRSADYVRRDGHRQQ